MKLYNKTKCPNEILEPLLTLAGRMVGARTSNTIVKVTQSKSCHISGLACRSDGVYSWHLSGRRTHNSKLSNNGKGRLILTDCGFFKITLPWRVPCPELSKRLAAQFFEVALHEFGHIRDYQNKEQRSLPWSKPINGRRPLHDYRPEEQRAECYKNTAIQKTNPDLLPEVIKLAEYLKGE